MTRPRHVVLVGLMGAGKTTVGVPLARALGWQYRDNDTELEQRTGRTAHDLAAAEGMVALHRAESETLAATLDRPGPDVISASAAVVADPEMRARLRSEFVVWVDRNPDVLADQFQRSRAPARHRPRPTRLLRGAVRNTRTAVPRDRRLRAATRVRSRSRTAEVDAIASAVRRAETGSQEGRH